MSRNRTMVPRSRHRLLIRSCERSLRSKTDGERLELASFSSGRHTVGNMVRSLLHITGSVI